MSVNAILLQRCYIGLPMFYALFCEYKYRLLDCLTVWFVFWWTCYLSVYIGRVWHQLYILCMSLYVSSASPYSFVLRTDNAVWIKLNFCHSWLDNAYNQIPVDQKWRTAAKLRPNWNLNWTLEPNTVAHAESIADWVLGCFKNWLRYFDAPTPPLIFTGSKSKQFGLYFRPHLVLSSSALQLQCSNTSEIQKVRRERRWLAGVLSKFDIVLPRNSENTRPGNRSPRNLFGYW